MEYANEKESMKHSGWDIGNRTSQEHRNLTFRTSSWHIEKMDQKAASLGITRSEYIRQCVRNMGAQQAKELEIPELDSMLWDLDTRILNSHLSPKSRKSILRLLREDRDLDFRILQTLEHGLVNPPEREFPGPEGINVC